MKRSYILACVGIALLLSPGAAIADVSLPQVIGSNMVLQREKPVPIWGWADPGEEVTVTFAGQTKKATADKAGNWSIKLAPLKANNKPQKMVVSSSTGNQKLEIVNVLVGDVWLCSGQSNMEWSLAGSENPKAAIDNADIPTIRLFHVRRHKLSAAPLARLNQPVAWTACTPQVVGGFSGVAYYFGRHLHQELKVPIGLIESAWGGTMIEPWTPAEAFAREKALAAYVNPATAVLDSHKRNVAYVKQVAAWVPKAQAAVEAGQPLPASPKAPATFQLRGNTPTAIYNAMIRPLAPFAIRGAIWYQGESNAFARHGVGYADRTRALINGWRHVWGQGDFPFYFVHIAPFAGYPEGQLEALWEGQVKSLEVPNTGMAVITDLVGRRIGNIHPANKLDVGKRLALWALAKEHGKRDLVYSGPTFKSLEINGDKATLTFDHVGGGLVSANGQPLTWFQVAGADKKFHPATAVVKGKTLVVSSKNVAKPVAVRFGWYKTARPNFANKEGLPAVPFRTDTWKDAPPQKQ